MYGYPGVLNQNVNGRNYLCVSHKTEYDMVQPLRLMSVAAGIYILSRPNLEDDRQLVQASALAVVLWSGWVWNKARQEMSKAYGSPYAGG